jgi:hypothetical protein
MHRFIPAPRTATRGIDLKVTPDDEVCCFEVNPSPAFSYYEGSTGQPYPRRSPSYLMQIPESEQLL